MFKFLLLVSFFEIVNAASRADVERLFLHYKSNNETIRRNVAPAVLVVEHLITELKKETDVDIAGKRAATLRHLIGSGTGVGGIRTRQTHGDKYLANEAERAILISAIGTIETIASLVDGNFSFHFCSRTPSKPKSYIKKNAGAYRTENAETLNRMAANNVLKPEEQAHITTVYAIARATQLRIENQDVKNQEIPYFVRMTINSRHLPNFMREIYKQDIWQSSSFRVILQDTKILPNPWTLIDFESPQLGIVQTLVTLKETDNNKRRSYSNLKIKIVSKSEITVDEKLDLYYVPRDGACYWYVNHTIYGYELPSDILELIQDNLIEGENEEFREILIDNILSLFFYVCIDEKERPKNEKEYFQEMLKKKHSLKEEKILNSLISQKELKYRLPESEYRELFTVSSECLRQIMEYYIDLLRKSLGETIYLQPPALVARPFLRPERNRLNWGGFSSLSTTFEYDEQFKNELFFKYSHQHHDHIHASVLVPRTTTPRTLVDWVKAVTREKVTGADR